MGCKGSLETVQHMMNGPFDDQILQALIDEALNRRQG